MRHFIRHPSDVPIEYSVVGRPRGGHNRLKNISSGGLCFRTRKRIKPGSDVAVRIPVTKPPFEAKGVVVWCNTLSSGSEVGIQFENGPTTFVLRMVEQVCHIEHYRNEILQREGRRLSSEEAAREWIARHAETFPD
jgi:Tfp pilus assembly protein PilZ